MTLFEIFDPKAAPRPIGIDLGTTHSLVAYMSNDKPTALSNCDNEVLVPSVVEYLADGGVLVGTKAKRHASTRPQATIVSVKRFMGRGHDDAETRRLAPYRFVEASATAPSVVRFDVGTRVVTPVEVSAEILRELKRRADEELGAVGGVVITVPAYFDDGQRQATKDAARLAGLEVLRLLNEPTAAALAYGLDKNVQGTYAVYDLGGGTFDVTILVLDDGVFQVRATGGDSALGGDDMDRAIAEELLRTLGIGDDQRSPEVVRSLLDAARELKHGLSKALTVDAVLDELPNVATVSVSLSRARFNELIAPLLERTGTACKRALRDAGLTGKNLDGVILVGGSTRVPAVREYVANLFGQAPKSDIDPDEVVALGAAIQADLIAGSSARQDVLLLDVLPLSLGIEVGGGVADKILPRNTTIPTAARASYTTQEDNQTGFEIHVVQGEREMVQDCRSLARFTLKGIPPMPAGLAKLEVTFRVDADGLLRVSAKEATTGLEQTVLVKPTYGLDDETVERMLIEAIELGEDDVKKRRLAEGRVDAARMIAATDKALVSDAALLHAGEREAIMAAIAAAEKAMAGDNPARLQSAIEGLDAATREFAGRRMNHAIVSAMAGKGVTEVESKVAHGDAKKWRAHAGDASEG